MQSRIKTLTCFVGFFQFKIWRETQSSSLFLEKQIRFVSIFCKFKKAGIHVSKIILRLSHIYLKGGATHILIYQIQNVLFCNLTFWRILKGQTRTQERTGIQTSGNYTDYRKRSTNLRLLPLCAKFWCVI